MRKFPAALTVRRGHKMVQGREPGVDLSRVWDGRYDYNHSTLLGMLLFKRKYLPAIRSGSKTQTIRVWPHRRLKAGQRSYIPGVGTIRIEAVEQVVLAELTDEDARRDGFDSAKALTTEIEELYAEQFAAGQQAYKVLFARILEDSAYG